MDMLTLSHVSKSFGKTKVIDDLSFRVPEHTVFGFIGKNGAGKTTTMKMILGLLQMDRGEIRVNGEQVRYGQNRTNRCIGYLPDVPEFYNFMNASEYLAFCGEILGMPKREICRQSERMLELVGLQKSDGRIQGFSRGMKQRLGIAQALLGKPKLLICDEPTSALDPVGRKEILEILSVIKEHTTVVFSTHILSDVERICDETAFLHRGSIALQGTIEEIRRLHKGAGFEAEFYQPEDARRFLEMYPGGRRENAVKIIYEKKSESDMLDVMRVLAGDAAGQNIGKMSVSAGEHLSVRRLEMLEPTLEDLFMEVVGE